VPSWWLTRGVIARLLLPLAWIFGAIVALRHGLYRVHLLRMHRVDVPVVVVGNLVAGGAGKTPVVLALIEVLRARGYTPGIVSRGYGGRVDGVLVLDGQTSAAQAGDEPTLLHRRSGAPVAVGRDRLAAARALRLAHRNVDVIVSDDGLQHLRLARDAQLIVFDERGVGNGWLMPAGPLRDALPDHLPPRTLVVYNAGAASTALPGTLGIRSLAGVTSLAEWRRGGEPSAAALEALRGRPVVAVAGVARPQRFFSMLHERGLTITPLPMPDHHAYATLPWPADTADVVVTEKDAIKLDPLASGRTRIWVAPLDFRLDADVAPALLALLPPPRSR